MAKDPAFLFYSADFLVGTLTMSEQEIGQYAFLLCVMHQKGRLSEEKMNSALKSGKVLPSVLEKFKKDENGCYYNERLEMESTRRSKFTASRRSNAKAYAQASAEHMPKHMENANENEIINKNIYGEFSKVLLKPDEYQKLVEKLGESNTKALIAELDRYIESTGKDKYKSHYATLQTWANRKVNEHQERKSLPIKTRIIA